VSARHTTEAVRSVDHHLGYLRYAGAAPEALPTWARLMARLGAELAEVDPAEQRIVVGVTLPTRGYAAAIASAAHVLRRNQLDPPDPSDADLHFEELRALPVGTPIKFMRGGRLRDGRLLGTEMREGKELLKISTRGMTELLPKQIALNVRPADSTGQDGDLRSRRIDLPPLLTAFVGPQDGPSYVTQSRLDCIIVGILTSVTTDLTAAEFGVGSAPGISGRLQDLVRARGVAGAATGSRTVLVPAGADEEELPEERPWLVVFDGGRGYIRLGHLWTSSHQMVIIDRSAPPAEPAAEALNFAYFERTGEVDLGIAEIPLSMELVAFEGSRS
jgi:hypothetical protein